MCFVPQQICSPVHLPSARRMQKHRQPPRRQTGRFPSARPRGNPHPAGFRQAPPLRWQRHPSEGETAKSANLSLKDDRLFTVDYLSLRHARSASEGTAHIGNSDMQAKLRTRHRIVPCLIFSYSWSFPYHAEFAFPSFCVL